MDATITPAKIDMAIQDMGGGVPIPPASRAIHAQTNGEVMSEPEYEYGSPSLDEVEGLVKMTVTNFGTGINFAHPTEYPSLPYNGGGIAVSASEQPQCGKLHDASFRVKMTSEAREALRDYQTRHELTEQSAAVTIAAIIAKEITK